MGTITRKTMNSEFSLRKDALKKSGKGSKTFVDMTNNVVVEGLDAKIKEAISKQFNDQLVNGHVTLDSELCKDIRTFIVKYLNENNYEFGTLDAQKEYIDRFIINFSGYGVLQSLLDDEEIEEIYVLGYDKVYKNAAGKRVLTDVKFKNPDHLKTFIDNILSMINRRVDTLQPIEDAHLPDFNRVAVSGDAISPQGFTFNIRKFRKEKYSLNDLAKNHTFSPEVERILIDIMKAKMNVIISGGTSSGKTTLLNALAENIGDGEFVITIEDNLELQLGKEFWLQLETRKPNIEGKGEITMSDELKHCLRRSPNRFIIGEIRDGEVANTFISATNTGHDGCMATVHSNSVEMCKSRISKLIANYTREPIDSCEDSFCQAINIVIQISFMPMSNRRILTDIGYICMDGTVHNWVHYVEPSVEDNQIEGNYGEWKVDWNLPREMVERFYKYGVDFTKKANYKMTRELDD